MFMAHDPEHAACHGPRRSSVAAIVGLREMVKPQAGVSTPAYRASSHHHWEIDVGLLTLDTSE